MPTFSLTVGKSALPYQIFKLCSGTTYEFKFYPTLQHLKWNRTQIFQFQQSLNEIKILKVGVGASNLCKYYSFWHLNWNKIWILLIYSKTLPICLLNFREVRTHPDFWRNCHFLSKFYPKLISDKNLIEVSFDELDWFRTQICSRSKMNFDAKVKFG